jgi:hypothetical protein
MDPLILMGDSNFDVVTLIGILAKRKDFFFGKAEKLANKTKSQPKLEERMKKKAEELGKKFHGQELDWVEFRAEVVNESVISAMAAAMLASRDPAILDIVWSRVVGQMSSHLPALVTSIKKAMDLGNLSFESNFAEEFYYDDIDAQDPDLIETSLLGVMVTKGPAANQQAVKEMPKTKMSRSELRHLRNQEAMARAVKYPSIPQQIKTWAGLVYRLVRYMANPTYNFFQVSNFEVQKKTGMSMMRRKAIHDDRVCTDCLYYESWGWQPIGTIPLPGQECICRDNCRCTTYYR